LNNKNNNFIKYSDHNLNFKWKAQSLFDLIISKSPTLISFKVSESAQIIFETDTYAKIKNQPEISLDNMVKKMEFLLLKTNRAELIFREKKEDFGVIRNQALHNNIIKIGKQKITDTTAFVVGILRENYTTSFDEITLFCDIQSVSSMLFSKIMSIIN